MAFRFKARDGSVTAGLRRMAREQIGRAVESIEDDKPAEAIHELRKRCKKLRGLIRLVRPAFPDYSEENAWFRDTAGLVGQLRDAKVMQDTYDLLLGEYDAPLDREELGKVRCRLKRHRQELQQEMDVETALEECRERLLKARKRCAGWKLEETGWDALGGGFAMTYARACAAAARIEEDGSPEAFHELRKRIKYHWHHCRILRPIAPDQLKTRAKLAWRLSDELGDHHDLTVFMRHLSETPEQFGSGANVDVIITLARRRSAMLAQHAAVLAAKLLADPPEAFAESYGDQWDAWADRAGFDG